MCIFPLKIKTSFKHLAQTCNECHCAQIDNRECVPHVPVSQLIPVYPRLHIQENELTSGVMHVAPF